MNSYLPCFPVNSVGFDFCYVVGDVVDDLHVERIGRPLEHFRECFSRPVGYHLPIDKGEVAGGRHCRDVVLSLRTFARTSCQFPVRELDVVLVDRALHYAQIVTARLVTVPSAPSVDQHQNLTLFMDAETFCDALIEDLVRSLDLDEMVSAA